MPELPEVEVVRRGLARWVVGRGVDSADVLDARSVRRHVGGPAVFIDELVGAYFLDVVRRGKFLWMPLSVAGPVHHGVPVHAVVVHLGMSGQLLIKDEGAPDERHVRVRVSLTPGEDPQAPGRGLPGQLRFVDQRIFGAMFIDSLVPTQDGHPGGCSMRHDPVLPTKVAHIARDPLDPWFDVDGLCQRLSRKRSGIKRVLLDQELISGIGNIYADEALWEAQIHYARPAETLAKAEVIRLLEAVRKVMTRALDAGGTSFDSLYVNVNGESGYFALSLNAYGQTGKPCKRCGTPIAREHFMNRSSHLCPTCQRNQ